MSVRRGKGRISVTFTVLIWVGILLCIFGAIVAVLGLGGSSAFEATIGTFAVKTEQTGLAIMVVGAALSFFTAQKLPPGVIVAGNEPSTGEKIARQLPLIALAIGFTAVILLLASLFFGR
jgi:hypothetical protein